MDYAMTRVRTRTLLYCLLLVLVTASTWLSPAAYALQEETPLMSAVRDDDLAAVAALLEAGADVNAQRPGSIEVTALMIAARYGYTDIMRLLIGNGADVNAQSDRGYTAVMRAARNGHTPAVRLLIESEADINVYNDGGVSALWYAAERGHADIVALLLDNGAYPEDIEGKEIETSSLFGALGRSHVGRKTVAVIRGVSFFAITILGLVSLHRLTFLRLRSHGRRLVWDVPISLITILLFLLYDSLVPSNTVIRIDLLILWPVVFFVLLGGVVAPALTVVVGLVKSRKNGEGSGGDATP